MLTLGAVLLQPLLIPLECVPINDLFSKDMGPALNKTAGAFGGVLFAAAIALTIVAGLIAALNTFGKNSKDWILKTFTPAGAVAMTIVAVLLITVVLSAANKFACG